MQVNFRHQKVVYMSYIYANRLFTNLSGRVGRSQELISNFLRDVIDVNTSGNPSLKL